MTAKKVSRRDMLKMLGVGSAGVMLVACAPATPAAEPTKAPDTKPAEATKAPDAPKAEEKPTTPPTKETIPLLYWFQAENHKPEYDKRQKELEDKFNVKLTFELLGRDAMTKKFPTTLMAGSGFPDIIEQNAEDIVKFLKGDDDSIPFVGMNDYLATSPYTDQVLKSRWDRYTKGGKRYGAPHDVHPIVMIYNDEEWKKAGVDMATVDTYDKLLEAMGKFDKKMPDGKTRIGAYDCLGCANLNSRLLQKGIWYNNADGKSMIADPKFKEALSDWFRFKDYWADIDWSNGVAMFKAGQVMAQFLPDWFYGIYKQGTKDDAAWLAKSPMRVTRIPGFTPDDPRSGSWGGTAASVPKLVQNKAVAMEMLMYTYFDNADNQLRTRFSETGIIPPVMSFWTDEVFKAPEPLLGGQSLADIFIPAAKALPSYNEQWTTSLITAAIGEQLGPMWAGEQDIDTTIATAEKNAMDQIKKNE